ncbi:PadR family transcriptional regulator [Haematobacter massiliensis]|uniref:PadR family transcriptional regulator n=1 Tax=Haematobacter massiliensis TaxID=195105 RepID=A0A086Y4V5_9RHOB|nr:bifunctional helix-turn-helix transcriptional regulator/GNAT family N-acetyltransferase [Haematobacter massiliensis]KFI29305.1 PadR family transcriptional regulator [Haematobacter massiliensis]OWJ69887.1 PadR family transcriptional regulator [Haematobacter massiliensis]OWJ82691.1 PadR family transcriptional regulator [Haematobacter massiliensis]QBJ25921.1 GNAT family N-acetyltransferase [Haematobacter massiliensis]
MPSAVARIRRFHRAVTRETGALDTSFLGRGRPLGPARVLNAIGQGMEEIGEIRSYLNLDSGLMSRLLRQLEAEGLLETLPDPVDTRRRLARLTEAGWREHAAYEALSDRQAADILSRHPQPQALLAAMDLVASALGRDSVTFAEVSPRDPRAVYCLQAYYTELGQRLAQGFDVTLSADPEARDMEPPRGTFLIALSDGLPVACGGVKGTDKGFAEVKRVWTDPSARGLGYGRRMMAALEARASALGLRTLRLDSNSALSEAITLYRSSGWKEIDRFNEDPYPDHFFEKILHDA